MTQNPLAGYGLPSGLGDTSIPRRGCVIDLSREELRFAAIATGLIWSGPFRAQEQAVLDIASGRCPMPTEYALPAWALDSIAAYERLPYD